MYRNADSTRSAYQSGSFSTGVFPCHSTSSKIRTVWFNWWNTSQTGEIQFDEIVVRDGEVTDLPIGFMTPGQPVDEDQDVAVSMPKTLQLTLTWMQAIAVALTIGGSIVYACVEIRIAVREIQMIGSRLAHHEDFHERSDREEQITHSDLDRRLSRIEGANGR